MRLILLACFLLFSWISSSQSRDPFTHQAVILDASGPKAEENFKIEIRILDGDLLPNKLVYRETHRVKTDSLGWYATKIGSGTTGGLYSDMSLVNWSSDELLLHVKTTDMLDVLVQESVNGILLSPHLANAKNIESRALLTLDCLYNLEALRQFENPEDGEMVCVKGHTKVRDGGEGFFYFISDLVLADDDGIVVKPTNIYEDKPGRWVRHIDGPINVNYYGIRSGITKAGVSNSEIIQRIIDYAASNTPYEHNKRNGSEITQGNTVFFPSGDYILDKPLILKSEIKILGEENTMFSPAKGANFDYFFKMDAGRVALSMENMIINGNNQAEIGGLFFKAKDGANGTGGLWQSRFKNINIVNIMGHGIHLEGGDSMGINGPNDYSLPNQMTVFENVRVTRVNDTKNSLRMTQYQGQFTFINCLFLGKWNRSSLGTNIFMSNPGGAVITFLNCTIQESVYGFRMERSSNITIDNCWFENLYFAIDVTGGKSINILNSRFANAAGYGSEAYTGPANLPEGIAPGSCINSEDSSVNVERNYVLVTNPNSREVLKSTFIYGRENSKNGMNTNTITTRNNTFSNQRLSRTVGIVRNIPVQNRAIILNGNNNVAANFDGDRVLRSIESSVSGGEYVTLTIQKTNGRGRIKIKDWADNSNIGNIALNGKSQVTLSHGQEVTFLKVDAPLSENEEAPIYYLVSISK